MEQKLGKNVRIIAILYGVTLVTMENNHVVFSSSHLTEDMDVEFLQE
jgi:hypothetical protein